MSRAQISMFMLLVTIECVFAFWISIEWASPLQLYRSIIEAQTRVLGKERKLALQGDVASRLGRRVELDYTGSVDFMTGSIVWVYQLKMPCGFSGLEGLAQTVLASTRSLGAPIPSQLEIAMSCSVNPQSKAAEPVGTALLFR